jgi:hypothetical protein
MPAVVVHDMVSKPVVAASKLIARLFGAVILDHPYNVESARAFRLAWRLVLRRYGRWSEIGDSAASRVLIGTQPSRP